MPGRKLGMDRRSGRTGCLTLPRATITSGKQENTVADAGSVSHGM